MHAGCSGVRRPDNIVVNSAQLGGRWQRSVVGSRRHGVNKALVGVPSCSISPDFSKDPTRSKEQRVPDPAYILFQQQGPVTPGKPGPKPESWGSPEEPQYVNVQFSVKYSTPWRQFLCLAGSERPLGWSFNIASKHPAFWNPNQIWVTTVMAHAAPMVY
jgi:hypothetical protein